MQELPQRITNKIWPEPMSGCWLWGAHLNRTGYGMVKYEGKMRSIHRVMWEFANGSVPCLASIKPTSASSVVETDGGVFHEKSSRSNRA